MVLQSTRFGPYNGELYQLVSRKGFSGYWVVQGSLNKAKEPKTSDIVLYYIHGGGYVAFAVANFLGLLLALWESANAINPNVSISIFALEYDMSPEAQYPIALEQAVSGYNYLVSDAGIDPRRIVLGGDSAGGK
jgi:acetyl esterase/lipase